jgi:serine protease AprX
LVNFINYPLAPEQSGAGRDGIRRVVLTKNPGDQLGAGTHIEQLHAKAVSGPRDAWDEIIHTTLRSIRHAGRVLALGLTVLAFGGVARAQTTDKADEVVLQAAREGRSIPVIVRYKPLTTSGSTTLSDGGSTLSADGGTTMTVGSGGLLGGMGGGLAWGFEATSDQLNGYLADDAIAYVSYDAPVKAFQLPPSTPIPVSIDASGAAAARSRYGITGKGVTVAVIDSGVQPSKDLAATRIRAFVDFVNGRTTPYDDYGHGTHVAHIIAGNGSLSKGQYTGAAPAADIVALKVLDGKGCGSTSKVLTALDWILTYYKTYNIRVVNLSLGHPVYDQTADDPLVQAVEALSKRGIVVVVASGNLGKLKSTGQIVYGSVTSPGIAPSAVTVGAVNTNGTLPRKDDFIADFSGRGPTRFEHAIKPDLVAPGYAIMSRVATSSYLTTTYPMLVNKSGYMRLNGTSMATPVVAGAAALLLSANPGLTAHTVKAVLQYTAQRLPNADVMTQGAGEINIAGAVRLAKLINSAAPLNTRWLKTNAKLTRADFLFGEVAPWGRATIWGSHVYGGQNVYMKLAQWNDAILWGSSDAILWGFSDNIVWSFTDNIVWSVSTDSLVRGLTDDNIVWSFTDDNIVWSFSDNIVWSFADNIVWSFDDNIVWSFSSDAIIWGFSDNIVWSFTDVNGGL